MKKIFLFHILCLFIVSLADAQRFEITYKKNDVEVKGSVEVYLAAASGDEAPKRTAPYADINYENKTDNKLVLCIGALDWKAKGLELKKKKLAKDLEVKINPNDVKLGSSFIKFAASEFGNAKKIDSEDDVAKFVCNVTGNGTGSVMLNLVIHNKDDNTDTQLPTPISLDYKISGVPTKAAPVSTPSNNNSNAGGGSTQPSQTAAKPADKEGQDWQTAVQQNTVASYQAYLIKYPTGKYLTQANQKINELEELTTPAMYELSEGAAQGEYIVFLKNMKGISVDTAGLTGVVLDKSMLGENKLKVTITDNKPHIITLKDSRGKTVSVGINPSVAILGVTVEDKGEEVVFNFQGGEGDYYINFIREGGSATVCLGGDLAVPRAGSKTTYTLSKKELLKMMGCKWLSGKYKVILTDANRMETKTSNETIEIKTEGGPGFVWWLVIGLFVLIGGGLAYYFFAYKNKKKFYS